MDQLFAWAWIVFAVMVISGNVLHLLYKKSEAGKRAVPLRKQEKVRARLRG
ncbi:hypothetical protein JCM9157_1168 [Halalkalibacter akibai JCM 9157]|uniref:Uncharacterized protein n=1 Tax=Halalkalibacter akibai (strain ATCC 43226 / DSM 21942 / CIP 109018 / JCM 9157 / 1139) TaxID=1236973 RepID=W4QS18_HALA3|nr:hypothetical protein JCM9157_1168 [Halalkalibacter akibai JCM 9157]